MRSAVAWEQHLTAAEVGCVRADHTGHRRFLHDDPHTRAVGFMVPTQHWLFDAYAPDGKYWRHGPVTEFSATPCAVGLPYAAIGEHTRGILRELGYGPDEIEAMRGARVVGWPDRP